MARCRDRVARHGQTRRPIKTGAQNANNHDLQMGPTIGAIERMVHGYLRIPGRRRFLATVKRSFRPQPVICGTKGRFRLSRWGVWPSTAGRRSKSRGGNCRCDNRVTRQANEQNRMRFGLRPQALFKLLRQRRKSPPPARSLLAMAGKLSAAEARRMVEEKRWALVRAHIACTDAIIKGRSASAARDYFDVYKRAVESNRKRLRHRGRRWPRLRF